MNYQHVLTHQKVKQQRDKLLAAGERLKNAVSDLLNESRTLEIEHYAETALHEWQAIIEAEGREP